MTIRPPHHAKVGLAVDPGDPAISAMEPAARRKRMLEACRAVALRGASIRPILFVFEDLHWVDTSTEEYLAFLTDSVASAPIMLLLTYRVGDLDSDSHGLWKFMVLPS